MDPESRPRAISLWIGTSALALAAAYLPHLGRGFLKDDYRWLLGSRVEGLGGILELFARHDGFYRPLVSLSFALNQALFGLAPFGFGLTNLLLVAACATSLFFLARVIGQAPAAALAAAAIWAFNPHGIGMAVLWISGRTSLLLVLFATSTAWAFQRGRPALAALLCLLALLSKEEAVLLPVILFGWAALDRPAGRSLDLAGAARRTLPLGLALAAYFALRFQTAAYLPWTAPAFYAPTLAPAALARNVLEYIDRACTFAAAGVLLSAALVGRWPRLQARERSVVGLGVVWLVGGYGLTVFLPVRSSLYACFPAVGAALIAGVLLQAIARAAGARRALRLGVAGALLPFLLLPVFWSRNLRLAHEAEFAATALSGLRGAEAELARGKVLLLRDGVQGRLTLARVFGTLVQDAVRLTTGVRSARVWLEPPPAGAELAGLEPPGDRPVLRYELRGARLVPEEPPSPPREQRLE